MHFTSKSLVGLVFLSYSLVFSVSANKVDETRAKFLQRAAGSPSGVIKLNSVDFDAITSPNRDWSVVIQLTALGNAVDCQPCRVFDPNFRAVAQAWRTVPKAARDSHFFASLDFSDGQEVFRKLGLNSAPVLNFYPAQAGPLKSARSDMWSYDFGRNSFEARNLASVLSDHTPAKIPYKDPPNYQLMLTIGLSGFGLALLVIFAWPVLSFILFSRWIWAVSSILSSLIFTSGYMYTRIRGTPFAQLNENGPQWIAGGYSNQYGAETYVVATLYGTLALSQIALTVLVPRILKPRQQRVAIYIWSFATILLYSVLMALFRAKNSSYPFRLLL